MPRNARDLISSLNTAMDASFRGRLLARGQAQSMIRRDGVLPEGSPDFSTFLDADLLNYGYALLTAGLDLLDELAATDDRELLDQVELARTAFIQSSYALEAAVRNAADVPDQIFHRLIAGAASHLGGFAARAFSLMERSQQSGRLTPMEQTLADLIMRNLDAIEERTRQLRTSVEVSDDLLVDALSRDDATDGGSVDLLGPVVLLLGENYLSAVSTGLFAIEIGNRTLLSDALQSLDLGERASLDVGAPGPWWVYRLTRRMIGDLFSTSIDSNVPVGPPAGAEDQVLRWRYLRRTFIDSLLVRRRSEIDLWPSQINVVTQIFHDGRDLVVALPTSSGKTRIAELAILRCLALGRRTIYITPLRALSAQTEQVLAQTFSPLGAGVSSLYGSMGISRADTDTLRSTEIVIATPEKLDFALRSDPSILDDVGLVVLDEGHMIGASEREVRYEAQIQRLLRRADAGNRRIICLSAVFPSGTELEDFVGWITGDHPDGLHRESWRPTQQRFGLVEWLGNHSRLSITLGSDQPFIPRYFDAKQPSGKRRKPFPTNQRELVIATAWRLVEEGQTVLIFCPQRNSVEPYARDIVKLNYQGLIDSLLPKNVDLNRALAVGAEWFGVGHPILKCLEIGVAIHHGALPGPFRREVERLLHDGKLKVTVASPTLAQGLNLSASTVLFHSLTRGREILKGSDFSNVIGRAGRAFVDTEGLVLYPIFEAEPYKRELMRQNWLRLTDGDSGKALDSGLVQVGVALLRRMYEASGAGPIEPFLSYLTGGPEWALPVLQDEAADDQAVAATTWRANLSLLDIGILSLIGDGIYDLDPDAATQAIVNALLGSLWERQLRRRSTVLASAVRELVTSRVRHIWRTSTPSQRRGWYLAGLGADAGSDLSAVSARVVSLMVQVEVGLKNVDAVAASNHLVEIASTIFGLRTFTPEVLVDDWIDVLRHWVHGLSLASLSGDRVATAQFIEADLIYRLVWGMEAARVFETAQGNLLAETLSGSAVTAIETGTFIRSASVLIRAGFEHRLAAQEAVLSSSAEFESAEGMREWIKNLDPLFAFDQTWPSPESRSAWEEFISHARGPRFHQWSPVTQDVSNVTWFGEVPAPETWLRITDLDRDRIQIWSIGFDLLGEAVTQINQERRGVLRGKRVANATGIRLLYQGPGDLVAPPRADPL